MKKVTDLGLAFFLTDFYKTEIPPSIAKKFSTKKSELPKTMVINGSKKWYGLRMRIIQLN